MKSIILSLMFIIGEIAPILSTGRLFELPVGIHLYAQEEPTEKVEETAEKVEEAIEKTEKRPLKIRVGIPYLGVIVRDISEKRKEELGIENGVYVIEVIEDSPADEAGIEEGDIIIAIDGEKIMNDKHLTKVIRKKKPGDEIKLAVFKADEKKEVELTTTLRSREEFIREKGVWGGGGGPRVTYIQPKLGKINEVAKRITGKEFEEAFIIKGGGGSGTIWKNLRIGGFGGRGSQKIVSDTAATLSLGYGGFLAEYIIPIGKLFLFIGGSIGGGDAKLIISKIETRDWDSATVNFNTTILSSSFVHYQPYLGIEFPITPWMYLTLRGGWLFATLNDWKEENIPVKNPPSINISNYSVSAGLTFGYFTH